VCYRTKKKSSSPYIDTVAYRPVARERPLKTLHTGDEIAFAAAICKARKSAIAL
jgi:hypothetical protein